MRSCYFLAACGALKLKIRILQSLLLQGKTLLLPVLSFAFLRSFKPYIF